MMEILFGPPFVVNAFVKTFFFFVIFYNIGQIKFLLGVHIPDFSLYILATSLDSSQVACPF